MFKSALALLAVFCFLVFTLQYNQSSGTVQSDYSNTEMSLSAVEDLFSNQLDGDSNIVQYRHWYSPLNKVDFDLTYSIQAAQVVDQFKYRNDGFIVYYHHNASSDDYWKQVYGNIHRNHSKALWKLKDSLTDLIESRQLNREQFAYALVNMVQEMPYWYIFSERECESVSDYPCIEGMKYGLLSPAEVASTAVGDCDSKSLLLYTLFRHFNYEPVIFSSDEYRHAMLGLNLPSAGKYLEYGGRKFYFWETTFPGWSLGELSAKHNNLKYWSVTLGPDA